MRHKIISEEALYKKSKEMAFLHNLSTSDSEGICALLEIWRPKLDSPKRYLQGRRIFQEGRILLKMSNLNYATRPKERHFK